MRLLLLTAALLIAGLLIAARPLLAAAPPRTASHPAAAAAEPRGTQVALAARPGTALDAAARQLVAQDLAAAKRARETPLVLTGSAVLGAASDRPALFVQLQSVRDCGSAGCSTTVYLWQKGGWRRVLDGVGGHLTVGTMHTRGMADLMTEQSRYAWTGQEYRNPVPAPEINLRRKR